MSLTAARKAMSARYDDLRWCGNDDDCHIKAEGVALALSDFDYAVSGVVELDADEWESVELALEQLPTWFPETLEKVRAIRASLQAVA